MATDTPRIAGRTTVLAVLIGGMRYSLPLEAVEEVLPALPSDWLPQAPRYLRGVVSVRGQLLPVVDAAEWLGVVRDRPLEPPIVRVRLAEGSVGLEVDEVLDLLELDLQRGLSADQLGAHGCVLAVAMDATGHTIRLLDTQRLAIDDALWQRATVT